MMVEAVRGLQIFRTSTLDQADAVHGARCPAALDPAGLGRRGVACRCGAESTRLEAGTLLLHRDRVGPAALVQLAPHLSPCWVEADGLRPTDRRPPVRDAGLGPPLDIALLEQALARDGVIKVPSRRRAPRGGELVWVRAEMAQGKRSPWRYFGRVHAQGEVLAVLLDPRLRITQAVSPAHAHVRMLPIPGDGRDPGRILAPVWPLHDGTADPGWAARTSSKETR